MATTTLIVTEEERHRLIEIVAHERQIAEDRRLLSRIDSPQEAAALADRLFVETILAKLRGG